MKTRPVLFFSFLLLISILHAQKYRISGTVVAEETAIGIFKAKVFVEALNIGTETDEKGNFELFLPKGNHQLEVFSFGMNTISRRIQVLADQQINFVMQSRYQVLDEVEIVDQSQSVSGITRLKSIDGFGIYEAKKNEVILLDDFAANKATNNARQIFAKVPGLNIWESDFAGLQLDIAARGLGPSRTANFNTRQNGYDMSADALGYPESYYLPAMQAVERIEIVRGAASLQYGTQFGGMLNFKIKKAPEKPFELTLDQSVGSFGLLNSFASVGGTKGKTDYYAYYQYRQGDGWRANSGFDSHIAFARVGYSPSEKLKVGFEYSFLRYVAQQPGGLTDSDVAEGRFEDSRRDRNWFQVSWNLMANTIDYRFSDRTKLNIRNFALISGRDALGDLLQIAGPVDPSVDRTLISDDFTNFGSEARLIHRYAAFGKNAALLIGARYYNGETNRRQGSSATRSAEADFRFLNPDQPENFDYDYPNRNYAVFAENLIDLTDKLSITPGVRFEHIRTTARGTWNQIVRNFAGDIISIVPNDEDRTDKRSFVLLGLGASYYLTPDLNLYSNFSQNFRSITFSDLRIDNPNFLLDSNITDENGFNADVGLRGQILPWLSTDISFFLLQYNNRIGEFFTTTTSRLVRTNIGDSRHYGVESFLEADLFSLFGQSKEESKLSIFSNFSFLNATYIRAEDRSILGNRVEYVPQVMVRTGVNYKWKDFKGSYQFSYLGSQFSDATNSTFNPNPITGIIPEYSVMDLSFEYAPDRYKVTMGVNNLMNKKYFTRRAVSYPGPGIIPATIRNFYLSLGVTL